ncbi:polysaccharide deacetylase family protein [Microbacter margulisiae]|uniref:DUF7033 domain-containing protein n=1 Tax=Microbacter margulisiae TaxID=1350067 RepID=A0A7W5DP09_9PORP|nr:polysaccharide deacetylase family protein [Microbacter margulisiae]MBB3186386.1 hypothetical protein [Microbacter margulisiae]
MMEILIYTPTLTPRIQYIFDYIFADYLQIAYNLTTSYEIFQAFDGAKFAYSTEPVKGAAWIWQHPLLLENNVRSQNILLFKHQDLPAFFGTDNVRSLIPFDMFAASFYLMTRYEEYLSPERKDRFGRYQAKYSLAVKGDFLQKPLVNCWIMAFMEKWLPGRDFKEFSARTFTYIPTYDIDNAYQFRHKGFVVNAAGMIKDLLRGRFRLFKDRIGTLLRLQRDAYDNYGFIFMLNKRFKLHPYFFILCAEKRGKYDRNLSLTNKAFRRLLFLLKQNGTVGLHPSFASGKDLSKITAEKKSLELVLKTSLKYSRQHYLLIHLPETYRALHEAGLQCDFTMGYASRVGFRASVCTSFRFFDLLRNEATDFRIQPLVYMDGTFNDYMQLSRKESEREIIKLIDEVKAVNGEFVSLWHNSSLAGKGHWRGWKAIYYNTLEYAFRDL